MAAWIGLIKQSEDDDCGKDDVNCLRQGWKWVDGTPYNYQQFHEWCECKGEKQTPQPKPGVQCAIVHEGKWFGVNCSGPQSEYFCFCAGYPDVINRDSIKYIENIVEEVVLNKLFKVAGNSILFTCFSLHCLQACVKQ